jgi:integrase
MERRKQARAVQTDSGTVLAAHVFHRGGEVVAEFRKSWAKACKRAGVNRLFHDLRRSAVKNLIDSGVNQKTAMEISGHKTDAMFRRYLIVSAKDKSAAMEQVQQHNQQGQNVVSM